MRAKYPWLTGLSRPNYDTRQNLPAKVGRAIPALYYADALEGMDPLGQRIHPHFYVDIRKPLPDKRGMLARHTSQREWLRSHYGVDEYLDKIELWHA